MLLWGSLLARLEAAGVGVRRPYRQGLGCGYWLPPADARGPQRFGLLRHLLARLEATGVGVTRPHRQGLGRGYGLAATDYRS